jgi:hypothetical protein
MNDAIVVTKSNDSGTSGSLGYPSAGTGSIEPTVNVGITASAAELSSSNRLGPQQLYGDIDDSLRSHVVGLLREGRAALERALQFNADSEFVQFDQQIMIARSFITRVLNCRQIGQGFTSVVNGANWALANRHEVPPTKKQLGALVSALNRLAWSPYMHFDTAMSILDELETAQLDIESPILQLITSELDD